MFVTCKTAEVEAFKSLKQKTTTKKTTKAGNAKKRNKYLVSSDSDVDNDGDNAKKKTKTSEYF